MSYKIIENNTPYSVEVILVVRKGESVEATSCERPENFSPNQKREILYGDEKNIYLNGVIVSIIAEGKVSNAQEIIMDRGDTFDNKYNKNDTIIIDFNKEIKISTRNSGR